MIEKVNPQHPDKVADRIAGAIVDLAYAKQENPKIAVEVLIGHGVANIIVESSVKLTEGEVTAIVERITGRDDIYVALIRKEQDKYLAKNQQGNIRCGDNGIFKGVPLTDEERKLSKIAQDINPIGDWSGGTDVDAGATNRKLGSDMAQSVTGGGLHGKDLSKADVSVNIYAFLKAQEIGKPVELFCAIGDEVIDNKPYAEIVEIARSYIKEVGGFEKFAEWGLF